MADSSEGRSLKLSMVILFLHCKKSTVRINLLVSDADEILLLHHNSSKEAMVTK